MKTKFNLNFVSAFSQKIETLEIFIVLFSPEKLLGSCACNTKC